MIAAAIQHIARELDAGLRRQFGGEGWVSVTSLVDADGSAATAAADKLAVFLVSVERDAVAGRSGPLATSAGAFRSSRLSQRAAPINLNLLVMFAANQSGTNYPEALKLLGHTIAFFQARPVLDHHNSPDLDRSIERLVLEIEDLSTTDLSNLWGVLGGRYVPSVLYRVRMVSIDAAKVAAEVPRITQTAV